MGARRTASPRATPASMRTSSSRSSSRRSSPCSPASSGRARASGLASRREATRDIIRRAGGPYMQAPMALFVVLALGIGLVAGLRSLTAPAVVAWAAHFGHLDLQGSPLRFMGSAVAVAVVTLGALAELVADQLPKTPARTTPVPLTARILLGGLSGACLGAAMARPLVAGGLLGAVGGVLGAFGGYQVRTRLVRALGVKDVFVAVPEDLVAIGLACLIVSIP